MLLIALTAVLAQAPLPVVGVIDASRSDGAYEDESRALAEQAAHVLLASGFDAKRLDESELPEGCKVGPCLAGVAKAHGLDVLVLLAASDVKDKLLVAVFALWGPNGEPLTAARYESPHTPGKTPKALTTFAKDLAKALKKKGR
mgnify:CR=1 FL=1